jgi:cytochrome c-type biogenesis protein CcmE
VKRFALRTAIAFAIVGAFFLTRGFGSIYATFAIALVAFGTSRIVDLAVQRTFAVKQLAVPIAITVGALVYVIVTWPARKPGPLVYREVADVAGDLASWQGERFKLHGRVAPGSIVDRVDRGQHALRFALGDTRARVDVDYVGVVPDMFRDGLEVVVIGRVACRDAACRFAGDELLAKCPSSYGTAR